METNRFVARRWLWQHVYGVIGHCKHLNWLIKIIIVVVVAYIGYKHGGRQSEGQLQEDARRCNCQWWWWSVGEAKVVHEWVKWRIVSTIEHMLGRDHSPFKENEFAILIAYLCSVHSLNYSFVFIIIIITYK